MQPDQLAQILEQYRQGDTSLEASLHLLESWRTSHSGNQATNTPHTTELDEVRLDTNRADRCGFPEVVYAPGKSVAAIIQVFKQQRDVQQDSLATRVEESVQDQLQQHFPDAIINKSARTVRLKNTAEKPSVGKVCVVSAGTSDRPVAEEVLETLRWMNVDCEFIFDVGVAGPHRLMEQVDRFEGADAVVVVAGMEGALPSVVGGWVACPVVAVPTSVGYGANLGGFASLLSMLNSCASNVSVVNIDAGFKGGYIAGMIASR